MHEVSYFRKSEKNVLYLPMIRAICPEFKFVN